MDEPVQWQHEGKEEHDAGYGGRNQESPDAMPDNWAHLHDKRGGVQDVSGMAQKAGGQEEMSAGKGDTPRPVKWAVYTANYDAIFRKKAAKQSDSTQQNKVIPLKESKAQKPHKGSKTK
jgi:hypothetical protein